jgi:acetyltransferase-like isoleucine patch superfamily enzyme
MFVDIENRPCSFYGCYDDTAIIDKSTKFDGFFIVGKYAFINPNCIVSNAVIGNYSIIEKGVHIGFSQIDKNMFSNHYFTTKENKQYYIKNLASHEILKLFTARCFFNHSQLVIIGNDVLISEGVKIFAGVNIGNGAIIYPNSVVDSDVPAYSIIAGNPAKVIGKRFDSTLIEIIEKLDWTNINFGDVIESYNFHRGRVDYSDIDSILSAVRNYNYVYKYPNFTLYDYKLQDKIGSFDQTTLLIGPSHVSNWLLSVREGLVDNPGFLLYGLSGLSLYDSMLESLIKKWLSFNPKNKVVLMVPDFRIGNAGFASRTRNLSSIYIKKEAINPYIDKKILTNALSILDSFVDLFGKRIVFLFWCLFGLEQINKKNNRHMETGVYKHPFWNYLDFREMYNNNNIDLDPLIDNFFDLIGNDGTVHPSIEGYKCLETTIKSHLCKASQDNQ